MYLKPFPCKLFVIQRYQVLYTRNVDFIFGVSRKKNSATSSKSSVLDTLSNTVSKSPANRFCPAVHRAASQRRIQTLCLCFEINQRIFHLCYSTDHLIPVNQTTIVIIRRPWNLKVNTYCNFPKQPRQYSKPTILSYKKPQWRIFVSFYSVIVFSSNTAKIVSVICVFVKCHWSTRERILVYERVT